MIILQYRGKARSSGEWKYGFLNNDTAEIKQFVPSEVDYIDYEVDPRTIGKRTSKKDKNKKEIFEADIVKVKINHYWETKIETGIVIFSKEKDDFEIAIPLSSFKSQESEIILYHSPQTEYEYILFKDIPSDSSNVEVIGNIYDNPELVELSDNAIEYLMKKQIREEKIL